MESGQLISAQRGGAPRADPGEPRAAGLLGHHAVALRRPAADPARRGRAQPPPHAVGAAPDRRGQRRLHRGGGRARDHAPGRFHHHAVLDLARPRQRRRRAGGLAGRPGHPDRALCSTAASPRTTRRTTQPVARPEGDSLARYGNNLLPDRLRAAPAAPRRCSPTRTRARASRSSICAAPARRTRRMATRCSSSTRPPAATPMPTMATFVQLLPAGFAGRSYRSTDGTVFHCHRGRGRGE